MNKPFYLVLLVSILSFAAVACGSEPSDSAKSDIKPASSDSVAAATDFSVPVARNVDGGIQSSTFSLSDNQGKSTVLYFSFAGWPTCGLAAPALGELQANLGDQGVEVLAIDIQPARDGMNKWIDYWHSKKGGDVTWALDGKGILARKYGVAFLGQTVVINRSGSVVYNGRPLNYESLVQLVEEP